MRIRIWNAFASNNSGSYVIVGRFPSVELASEVAAELLEVAKAQSKWSGVSEPSPLAEYAARHGIPNVSNAGEEWPEHSNKPHPDVWAVGHQVFVHSDYTVTMPAALGHVMYARGGRVETELDHTHHPIAGFFEIYFPWNARKDINVAARVQDIVDTLWAEDGALSLEMSGTYGPAWRGVAPGTPEQFGEHDLIVGATFEDLCAGFTRIAKACEAAGAELRVRVSESPAHADPFAFLRPSSPQPRP